MNRSWEVGVQELGNGRWNMPSNQLSADSSTYVISLSSGSGKKESRRPVAHECLGEVLRVLRQVINTYPMLNTVEILTAAGKLISKVKGQSNVASTPRSATLSRVSAGGDYG